MLLKSHLASPTSGTDNSSNLCHSHKLRIKKPGHQVWQVWEDLRRQGFQISEIGLDWCLHTLLGRYLRCIFVWLQSAPALTPQMNEQDTDVMVRATELFFQELGDSEGRGNMKNHLVSTCLAPACASWPWSTSVASFHTLLSGVTELSPHRPPWAGQACSGRISFQLWTRPGIPPGREKIHLHSLAPPLSLRNPFFSRTSRECSLLQSKEVYLRRLLQGESGWWWGSIIGSPLTILHCQL